MATAENGVKNTWIVRPKPHGIRRMKEFLAANMVAVGWPEVPDLTGSNLAAIKRHLRNGYADYDMRSLGQAAGIINRLVNEMQEGDLVVVPDSDGVYIAEVAGPYRWDKSAASDDVGYSHQRPVKWLKDGKPVPRTALPDSVRDALKGHQTLYLARPEVAEVLLDGKIQTTVPSNGGEERGRPAKTRGAAGAAPGQVELGDEEADEAVEISVEPGKRAIFTDKSDPTVHDLFLRYKDGDIELQPDYQRHFVWDEKRSSRLIESALLDVPLPIIYLAEDKDGHQSVIDGQQRLTSFFRFLDSELKLSGLKVLKELNGKTFIQFEKPLQAQLKRYSLRVVTIKAESDENLRFEIFERLNTGSIPLNDQELRNCIYRGPFNKLIHELSEDNDFKSLVGIKEPDRRMHDVELVLRFAAFFHTAYLHYQPPIKKFLNLEMEKYRNLTDAQADELRRGFKNSLLIVKSLLGEHAFRRYYRGDGNEDPNGWWYDRKFNYSLFDIQMGIFSRLDKNRVFNRLDSVREAMINLMSEDEDFIESIERSTSAYDMVKTRFDKWRIAVDAVLAGTPTSPRCFSLKLKEDLFRADSSCKICNQRIHQIDDAAVDHIRQYWQGGQTVPENARLAHRYCNWSRSRND